MKLLIYIQNVEKKTANQEHNIFKCEQTYLLNFKFEKK